MTAEDKPILVDGQPVMVVDPGDCHQYYLQHLDPTIGWVEQPGGYPAPIVEPPPPVFLEAAKMRFQSKILVPFPLQVDSFDPSSRRLLKMCKDPRSVTNI